MFGWWFEFSIDSLYCLCVGVSLEISKEYYLDVWVCSLEFVNIVCVGGY